MMMDTLHRRVRTVALVSGGLDSVTLAHHLQATGQGPLLLVSVNYGQRHKKELHFAERCAHRLGAEHTILPMGWLKYGLGASALVSDGVAVPEGHYAWDTMRQTVVANRNMILLALAAGLAVARKAEVIATAVHAGDHAVYPDCRPEFIDAMNAALRIGNAGFIPEHFRLLAPFVQASKAEIAAEAARLQVPIQETWSCYVGGERHCGRCGTCVERIEAMQLAGVTDPTEYEDTAYAATVLAGGAR